MDREVEGGAARLLKTVRPDPGRSSRDTGLSRMIGLSAVMHVVIIIAVISGVVYGRTGPVRPVAYMVELVGPSALGGVLGPAGRLKVAAAPPKRTPDPEPTAEVTSEPQPPDEASKPTETPPLHREPEPVKPAVEPKALPKPSSPIAEAQLATKKPKEPKTPVVRPPPRPKRTKKKEPAPAPGKKESTKKAPTPRPKKAARPPTIKDDDTRILAAIDRIRTSVTPGKRPSVGSTGPTPSSLGRAGTAGGGAVRGLAFIMYTRDVRERVRDSWVVTERKQGLIAKVRFGVRPDGKVFNVELIQRSGDSVFDQSVLRAVLRAGPLPPPPQKYAHAFAEEMVEITFGGNQ